jgi:Cd2+/Zn2+-exporting ATPase
MATKRHITLPIAGLDCMDCARTLEGGLAQLDGVLSSQLNFAASTVAVDYDADQIGMEGIVARVRELGYDVARGEELTFEVDGMDCADCAARLQQAVANLPGILEAQVNLMAAQMRVMALPGHDVREAVIKRTAELGYTARLPAASAAQPTAQARPAWRASLSENRRTVLTAAAGLFWAAGLLLCALGAADSISTSAFAAAIVFGGYYVAKSGWAALRSTHSLDMNVLMSIAAIGAVAIGEWEEGATAMFLFALGNTLEAMTMERARHAIRGLIELSPKEATRIHESHADRVPVEQLRVGDLIEVRPAERVPMDGVVQEGRSAVDQAPITGESNPVDLEPGSLVYAGSINGHGALRIRVTKLARDNTLSRIVQMVQEAQGRRAPAQRFVDTFAKYYTPIVIALAAAIATLPPLVLGASFSTWFYRALVLLVISCPCALVISTPVAIVSAISSAARRGVLVKGGMHLEAVARTCAVAFDKTGTLTEGRPEVTDVRVLNGRVSLAGRASGSNQTPEQLLALAASIDAHSQHPVARAIQEEAERRGLALLPTSDYQQLVGHGGQARVDGHTYYVGNHALFTERVPHARDVCQQVEALEAEGKTTVLVGNERDVLGLIGVADRVRQASAGVVQELQRIGIRHTVLLSGDNERTARAIGQAVGIAQVQSGLLPQDKVLAVEKLLADCGHVAMVGDGVNDAPAMARSTVGIAMGAASTDAALETADIVLMSDDLWRIPYVIRLGRRTLQNIRENIVLSLLIKGVFLILALFGIATLWMAVFADMGTSLIVTFNGMRLLSNRSATGPAPSRPTE